jgi:inorganic pyrophosphatase
MPIAFLYSTIFEHFNELNKPSAVDIVGFTERVKAQKMRN